MRFKFAPAGLAASLNGRCPNKGRRQQFNRSACQNVHGFEYENCHPYLVLAGDSLPDLSTCSCAYADFMKRGVNPTQEAAIHNHAPQPINSLQIRRVKLDRLRAEAKDVLRLPKPK